MTVIMRQSKIAMIKFSPTKTFSRRINKTASLTPIPAGEPIVTTPINQAKTGALAIDSHKFRLMLTPLFPNCISIKNATEVMVK